MSEFTVTVEKKMRIITAYNEFANEGEIHRAHVYDGDTMVHEVYDVSENNVLKKAGGWIFDNYKVIQSEPVIQIHHVLPGKKA